MNLIFGSASAEPGGALGADLAGAVRAIHAAAPTLESLGPANLELGALGDGGVVQGRARDGAASLVQLGAFIRPLPGGAELAAEPDAVAAYLLARYRERGAGFLDGVAGQYAVAVCDGEASRLLLGVDPAGLRTLFVRESQGALAFSSNLYALARALGECLRVDRSLEDFFLIHGFYPFGRTPYAGVVALPPGCVLEWRDGEVSRHSIGEADPWKDRDPGCDLEHASEEELADALYAAMLQATEEQLAPDERAAVLLGGFDSALVAAFLQRLGKRVETFSFFYQDAEFNQPHTQDVARALGTRHNWVEISRDLVEDGLRSFPESFNQPTNWPNYVIQTAHLCGVMRERGFLHGYSGDGCDGVFLGYPGTFRRSVVFDAVPALRGGLQRALVGLFARPLLERHLGHPYRVFLNLLRAMGREAPARGYLSFRILDEISLAQLRTGPPPAPERPLEELAAELARPFAQLPRLRLGYQGKAAVSPNRNKLVGSSDRTGVSISAPYLHPGLKAFATRIPESLLRPDARTRARVTGKYLLMKMAERQELLPAEVIYQPKVAAVDAPIDRWYAGPMQPLLLEIMRGLPFEYDESYVRALIHPKAAEALYKRAVMTDKVISHAVSLLATYATFTAAASGSTPE